ncbi:MAG: glycosyltransferase family 4 protein [Bacteroidota bacterium]
MPIKVLVISNYKPTISVRPEAEMFIGLKKKGVEVSVMTFKEATYNEKFQAADIRTIPFHPVKKFDQAEIDFIREELVKGEYHILHLFNSKAIINGIRAAKGLPVKVVLYRGYAGNVHWYDPTAYVKFLHPRVDKIVCVSQAVEDYFHKQLFFLKEKAITIIKGHDPKWYGDIQPMDVRKEFQLPSDAYVISCVANARPMKGIPYLVKSLAHLPENTPTYLLLIGNNMDSEDIKEVAQTLPDPDKVIYAGYRKDAIQIVAGSDVFVLPSIKGEGINKAVVEAMSVGIPPVVTNIAGNQGLVIDGESGAMVPSRSPAAIAEVLQSWYKQPSLRTQLGSQAQQHIRKNFHIQTSIDQTFSLYQSLSGIST